MKSTPLSAIAVCLVLTGSMPGPAAAGAADAKVQAAVKADAELTKLATLFLEACVTRDADYLAAHSIDAPVGSFTGIGTGSSDTANWTHAVNVEHFRHLKPVKWSGLSPDGYVVGDMAWFTDLAKGIMPDGQELTIRTTLIMRRIDGAWKAVHYHVSEPVVRGGVKKDD